MAVGKASAPFFRRPLLAMLLLSIALHAAVVVLSSRGDESGKVEALDGGADGLDAYRALAPQFNRLLAANGVAVVELGDGPAVTVPLAPGLVVPVPVTGWRRLALGERVRLGNGEGTVALDGERELTPSGPVTATVTMDGPRVVDVRAVLRAGVLAGKGGLEEDVRGLLGRSLDPGAGRRP